MAVMGLEQQYPGVSSSSASTSECVCVVLHVAVFTGTSATRPVSPHTSSPRFTTLTHCSNIISH
jgi:hypothetical protein